MRGLLRGGWVAAVLAALCGARASALVIDPTYETDVPQWARTSFQYAADKWDTEWIASTASPPQADTFSPTIKWDPLGSETLGNSSTSLWTSASVDYWYSTAQYKVQFNQWNLGGSEGSITFNSSLNWYQDTDGSPGGSQFDFPTVELHELGHQLGMTDTYELQTADTWGSSADGEWKVGLYDSWLRDSSGNAPEPGVTGDSFNETDDPVFFAGTNAMAANDGEEVPIYAPSSISGNSFSHLDEQAPFSSYLMSYSLTRGESVHSLSSEEWAMFKDMGWTMTPEPGLTCLALLAAGAGAFTAWRKRRRAA